MMGVEFEITDDTFHSLYDIGPVYEPARRALDEQLEQVTEEMADRIARGEREAVDHWRCRALQRESQQEMAEYLALRELDRELVQAARGRLEEPGVAKALRAVADRVATAYDEWQEVDAKFVDCEVKELAELQLHPEDFPVTDADLSLLADHDADVFIGHKYDVFRFDGAAISRGLRDWQSELLFADCREAVLEMGKARGRYQLMLDVDTRVTEATAGRLDIPTIRKAKDNWDEALQDAYQSWMDAEQRLRECENAALDREFIFEREEWVPPSLKNRLKYDYDERTIIEMLIAVRLPMHHEEEVREEIAREREARLEAQELEEMRQRALERWELDRDLVPVAPADVEGGRRAVDARKAEVCEECQGELQALRDAEGELEILEETPADLRPENADTLLARFRVAVRRAEVRLRLCQQLLCDRDPADQLTVGQPTTDTPAGREPCACPPCQAICDRVAETTDWRDLWVHEAGRAQRSLVLEQGSRTFAEIRLLNAVGAAHECQVELEVLDELLARCERERCPDEGKSAGAIPTQQPTDATPPGFWTPLRVGIGAGLTLLLLVVGGVVVASTVLSGDDGGSGDADPPAATTGADVGATGQVGAVPLDEYADSVCEILADELQAGSEAFGTALDASRGAQPATVEEFAQLYADLETGARELAAGLTPAADRLDASPPPDVDGGTEANESAAATYREAADTATAIADTVAGFDAVNATPAETEAFAAEVNALIEDLGVLGAEFEGTPEIAEAVRTSQVCAEAEAAATGG